MSVEERLKVAEQMVDALQFLHQENFVHADVKAENICTNGHLPVMCLQPR